MTLKDIAKETGVSAVAVSQVLNGTGRISAETSKRIIEAANRLNYSPNLIAKSLRVKETRTIGIAVSDASQMFFSKILRGIQDVAEEAGYNVMVSNTDQRPGKEKSVIETLMSMRIDGLIIASPTMTDQRYISYLKDCGVPIVILMRNWEDFDMVISDNNLGGYLSAEYLLRTGSKKIYYLLLPQVSKVGEDRLRGHIRALNEYGIEFRPEQVKRTIPSIDGGAESMKELLKNGFDGDAICCDCDLIAVGAMNELQKAGYKIPDQVRVCGFNDLELSPYVRHPLTTIRQNRYDIGREGAILLLDKIKYNNKLTRKVILPVELIIREST